MMEEISIYILHTSIVKENLLFFNSFINPKRKQKAEKLPLKKDKLLSMGAAYLLKKYLPSKIIKENINGKPYIDGGPYFNISHSGEYAVLAIHSTREVGVDIQEILEGKINTINYVLSEKERTINDPKVLFQMWSNKESFIKCKSTGLKDIKHVDGLPFEGVRIWDKQEYYSKCVIYDRYALSLTLKGKEPFDIKIENVKI